MILILTKKKKRVSGFVSSLRPLGCYLLVHFGGVLVVVIVTGQKQSQLLVLGNGV